MNSEAQQVAKIIANEAERLAKEARGVDLDTIAYLLDMVRMWAEKVVETGSE